MENIALPVFTLLFELVFKSVFEPVLKPVFKRGSFLSLRGDKRPRSWARPGGLFVLLSSLLALAVVMVGFGIASAQPTQQWSATLGGDDDEFAHAVAPSGDGGFVIAGETHSYGAGSHDGWLVKLDSGGDEVWSQTFGGAEGDAIYAILKTSDGGYILAGETHSLGGATSSRSNFWLIRTDSGGHQQWQSTFTASGGTEADDTGASGAAYAVRQTGDGGFVLTGSSVGQDSATATLLRTDAEGQLVSSHDLDDFSGGIGYDIAIASDGGFVIAGSTSSDDTGSDALLVKTDSSGTVQWSSTFGGGYNDEIRSVVSTSDGGYALGGFTWSTGAGQSDFWLVKVDADGEQEWERTFGGVLRDSAHSLLTTGDGGFVLAGWSESFRGGGRVWVVKTGPEGRLQWSTSHQATTGSQSVSAGARAIRQSADGGFIVAGWAGTIRGARDVLAVKMGPVPAGSPAPSGAVASLTNTGPASITSAAVAFDTDLSGEPHRFWYQGRLIDRDNPLPSGAVACSQPSPDLASGAELTLDQLGSFDTVYLDWISSMEEATQFEIDGDEVGFDFSSDGNGITGSLSLVSESPCEGSGSLLPEGPRAPGSLTGQASQSHPGSITLDWADSTESDIFGYAVYVSRSSTGPFFRRAWLIPDSAYADGVTTDGASYYYAVAAINSWGLESPKSDVLRVQSRDFTPPVPPPGLRATAIDRSAGSAQLSWTPSPSADLSGYRVYRQDIEGPRTPVTALLFSSQFEDRTLPGEGEFSYSVTAIDLAGNESDWSNIAPPALDFFGSVLESTSNFTGGGTLSISTDRGRVDVAIATDTEIRVPNRPNAGLGDLEVGDQVAVSLKAEEQESVANQVHLVPSRTRNRHLAGRVTRLTESEIVVQPPGEGTDPVTFQLSSNVQVNLHEGVTGLAQGGFVVVSFIATEGQAAGALSEINVIPGREPQESTEPPEEPSNVAVIRGVFQGINSDNANLIMSSTEVVLDVHTVMTTGVSVGDSILVEAQLRDDGSLLARWVEHDEGVGQTAARTGLRGLFQGRDSDTGEWKVSGIMLAVDARTYADDLPSVNQRVKVAAILREDGMLYAREIENLPEVEEPGDEHSISLEGVFREITTEGAWDVGGVPVQVDANTVLSGRPSVGHRVAVAATVRSDALLATEVSAASSEQSGPVRSVSIRGTVDSREDGVSLTVDGIHVLLSDLTKTIGTVDLGSSVRVKAELQPNGNLLAREVAQSAVYDETGETRANPVDIEGRIEHVGVDGNLTVNGIPVAISALTTVDAALQVGAPVQVRGLLQRDGSVLAREIVGYGPGITGGTEASVAGVVERVDTDYDGRTTGFVVDGIAVSTDRLTRWEVDVTAGVAVVAQAIVINGEILAVTVEPRPTGSIGVLPLVQMQGTVQRAFAVSSARPLDIIVNGITVRVSSDTDVTGNLLPGSVVSVTGSISGSVFLARKIELVRAYQSRTGTSQSRFSLTGDLEEIRLDSDGQRESLLLDGNTVTVVTLTVFQDEVEVGDSVAVEGIVRDGVLIAALVRMDEVATGSPELDSVEVQ